MKDNGRTIRTVLAVGFFACVASVQGQVVPSQNGRILDANPGLGSRYNAQVPSGLSVNSQLYVTGQVTGLSYFHGQTGSRASNQLLTNVPSSALSNFNRQSVNLSQALGGQTYMPAPYYDRDRTVLGVNSILAGQAATGSNVPKSSVPSATSLGQQLYIDALAEYRSVQADRIGQTLLPEQSQTLTQVRPTFNVGGLGEDSLGLPGGPGAQTTSLMVPSLSASDLFGISRGRQQADLARELYLHAHSDEIRARLDSSPRDRKLDFGVLGTSPLGQPDRGTASKIRDANQTIPPTTLGGVSRRPRGAPLRNQDVFMDMLITARQGRQNPVAPPTGTAAGTNVSGAKPNQDATIAAKSRTPGLVERHGAGSILIHSLAGESKDRFNIQMGRAGEQLRAKRFYEAASSYEAAGIQDRRNPLARVGRGLSLLGAGEALSASYEIENAMRTYPPLAQARLDLSSIVGKSVISKQLGVLDERIDAASPEVRQRLEFMATYLYYNEKQFDKAKSYAQRLVKSIQKKSLIRAYAEGVLADFEAKPVPAEPKKTPEPIQDFPEDAFPPEQ